ncbi:sugar O-acetyltransferase [Flagellimonas pelagia]|uniref:Sugar O-acetyltransferase n=1 Tax=Flagellimonas pelagia TaxID=2306998 RepID=A0A3A1NEG9_9FLAO|nr:sugar O-acetyltransferase [Allomuricauda maritima]RIV41860.1 sugar O-acetyltransferase [Allomuricauda maritima]TXJ90736.1 sugar O-acetyltransferase [Allomuricauda maritima]
MSNDTKDIFQRLLNGETVPFNDPDYFKIREASLDTRKLVSQLNRTIDPVEIRYILGQITGTKIDDTVGVFTPIFINHGKNLKLGKNVFINFDCTFLDLGGITIEDQVLIGPKVSVLSEGHPIDPAKRQSLSTAPILIKKNAWIGANSTILKGVTIGENSIVAAGSLVNKDVPDNVIVGGVPAKILKNIDKSIFK